MNLRFLLMDTPVEAEGRIVNYYLIEINSVMSGNEIIDNV